jgi:glycerol-3-phosphate dehydrogenase (NAD(P)+)
MFTDDKVVRQRPLLYNTLRTRIEKEKGVLSMGNNSQRGKRLGVVGCGGWGTALALLLHENGHEVVMWGVDRDYMDQMRNTRRNPRYLPEVEIPEDIKLTSEIGDCVEGSDVVIMATPTMYLREVCENHLYGMFDESQLVVNVSKGIEEDTLLLGSQVIEDVCGKSFRLAGLYGPSHAEEVVMKMPTTVVATSRLAGCAEEVQQIFMNSRFRVYTNTDVIGVELGAALKNVIAIAAGVCDGLGFGDNAKSALLTRGLAEIRRLGVAMGARPETFGGLTGLGDLITTCVSPHGRNRSVGVRIGQGEKLGDILEDMEQVAEGVRTTRSACDLAAKYGVEMPITREVYRLLFNGKDPMEAGQDLMERAPRSEFDGLG